MSNRRKPNRNEQRRARALAASEGISYMQALSMIRAATNGASSTPRAPAQMSSDSTADLSLFSSERLPRPGRDRWTQTDYQRLDEDDRQVADHVRRLMDKWYRRLPAHARPEIRQRFAAASSGAHLGAFWEMYLHEATSRLERDVDVDVGRDDTPTSSRSAHWWRTRWILSRGDGGAGRRRGTT